MVLLQKLASEINMKNLAFVPKHSSVCSSDVDNLLDFLNKSKKLLTVSGAGISTESGIPDYRSEEVGVYHRRVNFKPIQHQEFISSEAVRKRYWLKNFIGWPTFSLKKPNATHFSLTALEEAQKLICIVTQNVDNLHYKAGSKNVIELHGSGYRVKCLTCDTKIDRHDFQEQLKILNPYHSVETFTMNPDGDVDIDENVVNDFIVPECQKCSGILQPDIVFFGGNVPRGKVERVNDFVQECDSVLVLGSTLTVFSSYRIILKAVECFKPIAIVNIGKTRGDSQASLKINARCGEILPSVCQKLLLL